MSEACALRTSMGGSIVADTCNPCPRTLLLPMFPTAHPWASGSGVPGSLAPCNLKPRLAVGFVLTEFPHHQSSALTLRLDPPPAVINAAGDVRLVTRPVPLI